MAATTTCLFLCDSDGIRMQSILIEVVDPGIVRASVRDKEPL